MEEAHNPNKQVNTPPTQQPFSASPLLVLLLPSRLRRDFTSLLSVCLPSLHLSMCWLTKTSGISCPLCSGKSASCSKICDVLLCFLCPAVVHSSIFDQLTYTHHFQLKAFGGNFGCTHLIEVINPNLSISTTDL